MACRRRCIGMLWLCILLDGCSSEPQKINEHLSNQAPETFLTSGPPNSSDVDSRVHLTWRGADSDGTIDHFDFILIDHVSVQDVPGNITEVAMVEVPQVDDPRWQSTTARDSLFIATADSLWHDPQPDDSTSADDIRNLLWQRWHTFFIRAVDDKDTPDATPDYVSFNATTLAPCVWLTAPVRAGETFSAPPSVALTWDGEDPLGDGDVTEPVEARWVLIETQLDADKEPTSFPESLYVLPTRFSWSPWFSWNATDDSGRRAVLRDLERFSITSQGIVGSYLFAVQTRDEAGAISPVFDRKTPYKNNVVVLKGTGRPGPSLTFEEPTLGVIRFVDNGRVTVDAAAGQELHFAWMADGSHYGARAIDSRFGWDITQPDDESPWEQDWCADCQQAPPRHFDSGIHTFVVQARDDLETVRQVTIELRVLEFTRDRDLLWVDDTRELIPGSAQEAEEDIRWLSVLQQLAAENGFSFNEGRDVYDVLDNHGKIPPIDLISRYKSVIWSVRGPGSGLRQLARFVDPYLKRNANATTSNYLNLYLQNHGTLWITGQTAAYNLWPDLTTRQSQQFVNVPNWDGDVVEQHPGIKDAGTHSLLYALGVDVFDCGAGVGCGSPPLARNRAEHFCQGLEPVDVPTEVTPPVLQVGPLWNLSPTTPGRNQVGIFNMPAVTATQTPPLPSRPGVSVPLYTYVAGLEKDPVNGTEYPRTADGEAVAILAKGSASDTFYSRALCAFEPELLTSNSHKDLTRFLLVQHFGLGQGRSTHLLPSEALPRRR